MRSRSLEVGAHGPCRDSSSTRHRVCRALLRRETYAPHPRPPTGQSRSRHHGVLVSAFPCSFTSATSDRRERRRRNEVLHTARFLSLCYRGESSRNGGLSRSGELVRIALLSIRVRTTTVLTHLWHLVRESSGARDFRHWIATDRRSADRIAQIRAIAGVSDAVQQMLPSDCYGARRSTPHHHRASLRRAGEASAANAHRLHCVWLPRQGSAASAEYSTPA